jgi:hypothetical protein
MSHGSPFWNAKPSKKSGPSSVMSPPMIKLSPTHSCPIGSGQHAASLGSASHTSYDGGGGV